MHKNGPVRRVGFAGEHGTGKTRAILESPYSPILLIDFDDGSRPFMPYFEFERLLTDDPSTVKKVIQGLKNGGGAIEVGFRGENEAFELQPSYGTIGIDTWAAYQTLASEAYFKAQPEWRVKKQSALLWGEIKNALARQIHELSAYCHLLIVTAHVRQAYDDGEPVPQVKEAKFYDRVWQTLDLVGYLVRENGQGAPNALFTPPHGKARLPAMPESLSPFTWGEVFEYAVTELVLPNSAERRQRIEECLVRFRQMVGEAALGAPSYRASPTQSPT
jgi:hypothetical protein